MYYFYFAMTKCNDFCLSKVAYDEPSGPIWHSWIYSDDFKLTNSLCVGILKLCSKLRHEARVNQYQRAEKKITVVPGHLIKINETILSPKNWITMAEQGLQCSSELKTGEQAKVFSTMT